MVSKERYSKLNDIESSHLKIFRQFFKIYKLDRKSTTKVGNWKSSDSAIETLKESYERWIESHNKDRFDEEWADNSDQKYIVQPD